MSNTPTDARTYRLPHRYADNANSRLRLGTIERTNRNAYYLVLTPADRDALLADARYIIEADAEGWAERDRGLVESAHRAVKALTGDGRPPTGEQVAVTTGPAPCSCGRRGLFHECAR